MPRLSGYFGIFRDNIPFYDGINGIFPFREYPVPIPRRLKFAFIPFSRSGDNAREGNPHA